MNDEKQQTPHGNLDEGQNQHALPRVATNGEVLLELDAIVRHSQLFFEFRNRLRRNSMPALRPQPDALFSTRKTPLAVRANDARQRRRFKDIVASGTFDVCHASQFYLSIDLSEMAAGEAFKYRRAAIGTTP
jgi:hypothetical protein